MNAAWRLASCGAALSLILAAGAEAGLGERVAVATDQGRDTYAIASDYTENPRRWALRVEMTPHAAAMVDWHLSCYGAERSRATDARRTLNPPAVDRIKPNLRHPDSCYIRASVHGGDGKLHLTLFARTR